MIQDVSDLPNPRLQEMDQTRGHYSDGAPSADLGTLDAIRDVLVVFESCKL
jgi:hypothetical protein